MSTENGKRKVPNILVTGTPGVGKSALCKRLQDTTCLKWLDVSKVAKVFNCFDGFDEVYQCPILDEDRLLDELEKFMCLGGHIIDYHSCEFFPERWFDVVYVLRTDNTTLYDRLIERGYFGKKLEDNLDCEIFQTILEEAKNSYSTDIVHELQNTTLEDQNKNVAQIVEWTEKWVA